MSQPINDSISVTMLNGSLLVCQDDLPEQIGEIAVPAAMRQASRPQTGVIVALDESASPNLSVGDRVAFAAYAGCVIALGGERFLILDAANEVLMKIEGDYKPELNITPNLS